MTRKATRDGQTRPGVAGTLTTMASADECFAKFPVTVTTPEIKIQTREEHKFVV